MGVLFEKYRPCISIGSRMSCLHCDSALCVTIELLI